MAEQIIGAVRVSIEVDHPDLAGPVHVGQRRGVRPQDRVVSTEHDRDRADLGDLADQRTDRLHRVVDAQRIDRGVAVVDHSQHLERPHARARIDQHPRHIGQDSLVGPKRAGSIRRAPMPQRHVHGRAKHGHIDLPGTQVLLVEAQRYTEECGDTRVGRHEPVALQVDRPGLALGIRRPVDRRLPDVRRQLHGQLPCGRPPRNTAAGAPEPPGLTGQQTSRCLTIGLTGNRSSANPTHNRSIKGCGQQGSATKASTSAPAGH